MSDQAKEGEFIDRATFADIDAAAGNPYASDTATGSSDYREPQAGQGREQLAGMIGGALAIVFQFVASRRGGHWQLSAEEATGAGEAYADLLQHYYPDAGGGPLTAAVLVTAGVLAPRIMLEKMQAEREAGGDGTQPE